MITTAVTLHPLVPTRTKRVPFRGWAGKEGAMKVYRPITEKDIRNALRQFMEEGGLIRKLPDEVSPRVAMVGINHGMYENPVENYLY